VAELVDARDLKSLAPSDPVEDFCKTQNCDPIEITANPADLQNTFCSALVVERDDGRYQIGFEDCAPGPFESRPFALAVAARFAVSP
jgi:hypothetical protein